MKPRRCTSCGDGWRRAALRAVGIVRRIAQKLGRVGLPRRLCAYRRRPSEAGRTRRVVTSSNVLITVARVMEPDTPTERPTLRVMVVRCDWQRGENPGLLMNHAHCFAEIDILSLKDYEALGFRFVALDPDDELRWHLWRKKNPEAA